MLLRITDISSGTEHRLSMHSSVILCAVQPWQLHIWVFLPRTTTSRPTGLQSIWPPPCRLLEPTPPISVGSIDMVSRTQPNVRARSVKRTQPLTARWPTCNLERVIGSYSKTGSTLAKVIAHLHRLNREFAAL